MPRSFPNKLQWGRTREGAETLKRVLAERWTDGFNGAAPVKVRKQLTRTCFLLCSMMLQWGRTREGAETPIARREGILTSRLQWGRTREGAETIWSPAM